MPDPTGPTDAAPTDDVFVTLRMTREHAQWLERAAAEHPDAPLLTPVLEDDVAFTIERGAEPVTCTRVEAMLREARAEALRQVADSAVEWADWLRARAEEVRRG